MRKAIAAVVLLSVIARSTTAVAQVTSVDAPQSATPQLTAPSIGSALVIGSRVRIKSTAVKGRTKGFVVALDDRIVTLAKDGGLRVQVPMTSITTLETSVGGKRHWLKGLAIGAVVGLLSGLTAKLEPQLDPESIAAVGDVCFGFQGYCSRGEAVRTELVAFSLVGLGIGALIKTERWKVAPLTDAAPPAQHGRPHQGTRSDRTAP